MFPIVYYVVLLLLPLFCPQFTKMYVFIIWIPIIRIGNYN